MQSKDKMSEEKINSLNRTQEKQAKKKSILTNLVNKIKQSTSIKSFQKEKLEKTNENISNDFPLVSTASMSELLSKNNISTNSDIKTTDIDALNKQLQQKDLVILDLIKKLEKTDSETQEIKKSLVQKNLEIVEVKEKIWKTTNH